MGRNDVSMLIAVFRENYQELLRFLTRRTGDAERAADLAQDTFVRLSAMPAGNVDIENPRAFVYRVAGNLAIDAMRREARIQAHFATSEVGSGRVASQSATRASSQPCRGAYVCGNRRPAWSVAEHGRQVHRSGATALP